jgi:allophanate hydrolase subunit 2
MSDHHSTFNIQHSTFSIEILAAGPLMTVQDLGRPGARRYGVSPGGALDTFALAAANRLVGNPPAAAGLEITAGGAALRLRRPALIALAGGDLAASLDGRPIPLWTAVLADAGATLGLAGRRGAWGARAYLAVAGGVDVPPALGARATDLAGGFGGLEGRALRAQAGARRGPALA